MSLVSRYASRSFYISSTVSYQVVRPLIWSNSLTLERELIWRRSFCTAAEGAVGGVRLHPSSPRTSSAAIPFRPTPGTCRPCPFRFDSPARAGITRSDPTRASCRHPGRLSGFEGQSRKLLRLWSCQSHSDAPSHLLGDEGSNRKHRPSCLSRPPIRPRFALWNSLLKPRPRGHSGGCSVSTRPLRDIPPPYLY